VFCHQLYYLKLQGCYSLNFPSYFTMPMPTTLQMYIFHSRAPRPFFHVTALVLALLKVAQPLKYLVQGPFLVFIVTSLSISLRQIRAYNCVLRISST